MGDEESWAAIGLPYWAALGVAYAAFWIWLTVRIVDRRKRWAKRMAFAAVVVPVLYVLSSGPMTIVACHCRVTHTPAILPDGTRGVEATSEIAFGKWFWMAYAPLFWASEQSWGEPVFLYWELFLFREAADP